MNELDEYEKKRNDYKIKAEKILLTMNNASHEEICGIASLMKKIADEKCFLKVNKE